MTKDTDPGASLVSLHQTLEHLGLGPDLPTPEQWRGLVSRIEEQMQGRDHRIEALEEVATTATEELTRIQRALTLQYRGLGEDLELLRDAIAVFREATRQGDEAAVADAIRVARQRLNLQLGPGWAEAAGLDGDTEAHGVVQQSVRGVQTGLRSLSESLGSLVLDTRAMAASRRELNQAGTVQRMLVPPDEVHIPGARLHAWFQPAAPCGGDWWTAHALTEDCGLVVIGDVTGHGAPAAIITGAVKGACDLARMGMRGTLRPSQLMRMLNRVIVEAAQGEYMMTGIALTRRADAPQIQLTNAGHQSPWTIRNGKTNVIQGVREPPLGAEPVVTYTELNVQCEPGDLMVLLTDGITEAEDRQGHELGERAVRALCDAYAHFGAPALRDRLRDAVLQHRGDREAADDITLVVLEVL